MKVDVLGAEIDNIDMNGAVARVLSFTEKRSCCYVFTPNAEMVMTAVRNQSFMKTLNSSDLLIPDGAGVVLGAKILGTPVKEKVAGIELVLALLSSGKKLSVFLYGGAPGIAEKAASQIREKYSNITVCGTVHGYHDASLEPGHIEQINIVSPDILLVALGVPGQENWIVRNHSKLKVGAAIGCGGTLDFLAGVVKRTPEYLIKLNLEWLDRLIRQPKRLGRMMRIPVFLLLCLKKRLFRTT